ncbi:MAG: hypothetical protein CFE21_13790 [Bacteroidetes bacterium B1(2017)]|nr:MAG: hypothetical protein CFE21_13790 [Bacteroidetes bacterium B1(2017)]
MKSLAKIILIAFCFLAFSAKAQTKTFSSKITKPSNEKLEHGDLANKTLPEVMKALNLTAKDTIGKTGTMFLEAGTQRTKYFYLALKDGTTLGFYNGNVSAILPKR